MTVLHEMEAGGLMMSLVRLANDEARLIEYLAYFMILMAVIVVITLQFLNAAYGRYSSSSWGFEVNARVAWFLQELPSFVLITYYFFFSNGKMVAGQTNTALMILFMIHYFQRTFIFTYLIRGGKPTPFFVFISAVFFTLYNGYMQGCYLAKFADYPETWYSSPRFLIGVVVFLCGMAINIHSDHILRNLRKPGERGYKIPRGGFFELVSGANFFGEMVEWSGFALASGSLPGLAFAIFTAFNIGPRAVSHHRWYQDKFGSDYPKNRRALIPWIL